MANYVLLDRIELNTTTASVTFDNIPQTGYTDLKIVMSTRSTNATVDSTYISFNGSTASFSGKYLQSTSSGTPPSGSLARYTGAFTPSGYTANTFGNQEIYIPNYTSSNFKSFSVDSVTENNATTSYQDLIAGLWSNTAAITSVTLSLGAGSFAQYSTFSLYGIAKLGTTPAIAPKADGGNVIGTDGTYWYHAFLSNGTFTPQASLTCDVLQVAGGGAGAWGNGGGGGAGGISYLTSQFLLNAVAQTVTVGAGAARITTGVEQQEANGSNSQLGSLTPAAVGGGGGATFSNLKGSAYNGKAGGSGGGGGGTDGGASNAGGAGTSGQGNNGGNGTSNTSNNAGGGGGGAGAVGANGSGASTAGAGGAGTNTYSSWLTATALGVSNFIAGGGGGGGNGTGAAGGSGGGGAGGTNAVGTAGTANTGSGGGGGGGANVGANGGSGIVIIRYPVAS